MWQKMLQVGSGGSTENPLNPCILIWHSSITDASTKTWTITPTTSTIQLLSQVYGNNAVQLEVSQNGSVIGTWDSLGITEWQTKTMTGITPNTPITITASGYTKTTIHKYTWVIEMVDE